MEFGPKRGHILFIFENFFKDFSLLFIALIIGLVQGDMDFVLENIGVLVVVLIRPISRVVQYFTTTYAVDSEKLIIKSGLLKKNNLEVPLSTITTVDFSQGILHQFFGAYRLNVDNASNISATNTKINMTFGKEDAFAVRDLLIKGRNGLDGFNLGELNGEDKVLACDSEKDSEQNSQMPQRVTGKKIQIKSSDLLLYGLLKSKITFFFELIAVVSSTIAVFNISDTLFSGFAAELVLLMGIGYAVLTAAVIIFVISVICGMAGSLIRYYGFEIMDNGQAIKIEYGLLTKKRYTIQKNRVSGFSYQQSFLMKLLGTGTLQLFAIGYGQGEEGASEEPILFPLIQKEKVRDAMAEILPEMQTVSDYIGAAKGSLRYFFYGFGFVTALAIFAGLLYCSLYVEHCGHLWILGSLIMLYSVAGRLQAYKNAAIYGNDDNVSLVYGGFQKTTIFVKSTHVESTTAKASRWKAKKGIASITVSYIAPLTSANKVARNVPLSAFEEIRKRLIY